MYRIGIGLALLLCACAPQPNRKTESKVVLNDEIALQKPELAAGLSINEALADRRSWREYGREALTLEELRA